MTIIYTEMQEVGKSGMLFLKETPSTSEGRKRRRAVFKCTCGNEFDCLIESVSRGSTKSCGCTSKEMIVKANTTHGASKRGRVTKLYQKWSGMKQRCYDKNDPRYADWGGRGIRVCDHWRLSFPAFESWSMSNGFKDGLEIDRIDNDGNYGPSNCRFVTRQLNCRNRRVKSTNKTGIQGVNFDKKAAKFRVRINLDNNKRLHIGFYIDFFEACCARKSAENRHWNS